MENENTEPEITELENKNTENQNNKNNENNNNENSDNDVEIKKPKKTKNIAPPGDDEINKNINKNLALLGLSL